MGSRRQALAGLLSCVPISIQVCKTIMYQLNCLLGFVLLFCSHILTLNKVPMTKKFEKQVKYVILVLGGINESIRL